MSRRTRAVTRAYGTGSVTSYETKKGTRYRYEVSLLRDPARPELGSVRRPKGGFLTEEDAHEALLLRRADAVRGVDAAPSRDKFAAYAQRWVDGYPGANGTRTFLQRMKDAMDPYIGHMRMSDIRPTDLATAYRGLEAGRFQKESPKISHRGLAPVTVARYAGWVVTIFNAAIEDGVVTSNPGNKKASGRPRGQSAERSKPFVIWDAEQVTTFTGWAVENDEPWAVGFTVLVHTGLRSGELLGLRWSDINFDARTLLVERALRYDETLPAGKRYVLGPVKGGRPRTVRFGRPVAESLLNWRDQLAELQDVMLPTAPTRKNQPLFPHLPGRAPTQSGLYAAFNRAQRDFRAANPDADLPPISIHDLRHTHASLLFHAGQSVKVVQERLGHRNAQVTLNTYAHLLRDAQEIAVDALDALLETSPDEDEDLTNG